MFVVDDSDVPLQGLRLLLGHKGCSFGCHRYRRQRQHSASTFVRFVDAGRRRVRTVDADKNCVRGIKPTANNVIYYFTLNLINYLQKFASCGSVGVDLNFLRLLNEQ